MTKTLTAASFSAALLVFASPLALAQSAPSPAVVSTTEALRDKALAGSTAYGLLETLTTEIGPRLAGSDAEHRAAAWGVATFKAMGLANVHTETFAVPGWTRGEERAEIVGTSPQRLVVTALGGSVATPPEGIEADAVVFRTYQALLDAKPGALTGKIAVVIQPMPGGKDGAGYGLNYRIRGQGASEAAKRGAVGYLMRSLATNENRAPHTGTMVYMPEFAGGGASGGKIPAAALSVIDAEQIGRLADRGAPLRLKMVLTPTVRVGATAETVVGDVVGSERPDEIVLIGGHLDSWDLGTGAIDDGAGVAITTAAAKLIQDLPRHPRRTIRVVMFGAEEIGKAAQAFASVHAADEPHHVIASECDFGAEPVYAISLPKNAAGSAWGLSLAKIVAPLDIEISAKLPRDGGADLEALKATPVAELAQDGTHYFDLHHSAEDTLDKVKPASLDKAVAAWVSFAYLAADTDVDFRSLAAQSAVK